MSTTALACSLQGELTIPHAAQQREQLLATVGEAIKKKHAVQLDLSAVEAFDSAGLQLLMATRRSLQQAGLALHLQGTSGPVRDVFAVYGLDDWPASASGAQP
jgi:anti-sigma B factor antagonist